MAVTQFQRSVWRKAANWRGASKPLAARSLPALLLEDPAVELVVPEDVQRLALGVVVRAGQPDERRLAGSRGLDDLLDEPSPRAHLDQFAQGWWPFR